MEKGKQGMKILIFFQHDFSMLSCQNHLFLMFRVKERRVDNFSDSFKISFLEILNNYVHSPHPGLEVARWILKATVIKC